MLLWTSACTIALLAGEPSAGTPSPTPASAPIPQIRIPVGETRVVALPLGDDHGVRFISGGQAARLAGEPLASAPSHALFVRVQGLAPGEATIQAGAASAKIIVTPRSVDPVCSIIEPAAGATVWGKFAVGVELPGDWAGKAVRLNASAGSTSRDLEAVSVAPAGWGPTRRALFEVDAAAFESGILSLTPVLVDDRGEHPSPSVSVRRLAPGAGELDTREAEAPQAGPRPKRFALGNIHVGVDPRCSGGKYFSNAASEPALCLPVHASTPGLYQVIATVGGTEAAGALPTVSIILDDQNYGLTSARLVSPDWHRLAIGSPILVPAGDHTLTLYFENDFYVAGRCDRNLGTDKVEILRLCDADPHANSAGGSMTGAMSSMMASTMAAQMMSGSGMSAGGAATSNDPAGWGESPIALKVAALQSLDGQALGGETTLHCRVYWPGEAVANPADAPESTLLINGQATGSQRAMSPAFFIAPGALKTGENTLQVVTTWNGLRSRTPAARVRWEGPELSGQSRPQQGRRFSVRDDAWTPESRKLIHHRQEGEEQALADLASNGFVEVTLPKGLTGEFDLFLEGKGDHFEGAPIAECSVVTPEGSPLSPEAIKFEMPPWWGAHRAGKITIPEGDAPRRLRVAFTNDKYEKDKGDRNLMLYAVQLRPIPTGEDRTAPSLKVVYPLPEKTPHAVWMHDVVLVEAADDRFVQAVELLIDGADVGLSRWFEREGSLQMVPLPARGLEPGEHTLTVRVRDAAGNTTSGPDIRLSILSSAPASPLAYDRAVTLLNRFAYGPDPRELAAILTQSEVPWLRSRLAASADEPGELAALDLGLVYFWENSSDYHVRGRALTQALATPNPVRNRLVLWAENHFSTWVSKTEAKRKWREHVAFCKTGPGAFYDLLLTSAQSPAMLRYLDQVESFAGKLNENYAREIMELHTLGVHGGYAQADVTNLARLLTGWTAAVEADGPFGGRMDSSTFRFDPSLSDGAEVPFLGMNLPATDRAARYDRVKLALEILAAHPSTAEFICTKLAAHYVASPPDPALVRDLASVFTSSGGDLSEVLVAMAQHPAFWSAPERLTKPQDYCLRMLRAARAMNAWMCIDFLQRSGFGLFDRATPDGYPEDDHAYADSNAMVQRWRMGADLRWNLAGLVPGRLHWGDAPRMPNWADKVVDSLAIGITGRALGPDSHAAAGKALEETPGAPNDRIRDASTFIVRLPEFNLK